MLSNVLSSILHPTMDIVSSKFLAGILEYLISLTFVRLPSLASDILTLGKDDHLIGKRERIRAKLTNGSDPSSPYRALETLDKLQSQPEHKVKTLACIPDICLQRYPDRETMGVREILGVEEKKQSNGKALKKLIMGDYKFTTYREICARIDAIGRGLLSLGAKPGGKVLILSETRVEWLCSAFAAFQHGVTVVTLLPALGEDALKYGINESEVEILIISYDLIPKIEKIFNQTKQVRYIVYFPSPIKTEEAKVPKDKNNIQFISLSQLEEQGKNADLDEELLKQRPQKTDTAIIMYTSGSTGIPKGVLLSHENFMAGLTGLGDCLLRLIDVDNDIYVAYLPLAHIMELICETFMFYLGVKFGYSTPQTLTDQSLSIKEGEKGDLQVLRPNFMVSVPTIIHRIHKTINEEISRLSFFERHLFNLAYAIKDKRLKSGLKTPILDRFIFSRYKQMTLGGQVRVMFCGGALLTADDQRFTRAVLCDQFFQAYGLTEVCGGATFADAYDITDGRVGHPAISCEIRLVNWDEGQYKNTDKPNPRGEILIGGDGVAQGYFGQASKENVNFVDIDGMRYFCTGDIGEVFPDGTLKIIDRKKDLVKLRNGEFMSLTKVEAAINELPLVENCCVCTSSSAEYPVALICTKAKEMETFTEKHFNERDWKKLVDDEKLNKALLQEIEDVCKVDGIMKYEIPQRVKVVMDFWTPETGLVTGAFKLKRKAIEEKYKVFISELYQDKPKLNRCG